jgi:fatty acid desaturase
MALMTAPIGPQNDQEMLAFQQELDDLRDQTRRAVGEEDAEYIRNILRAVRWTEAAGRALLLFGGWFPPTWILGAALLGISKILDNMELGHNVMHGQFDWMNDPRFNGPSFEWDNACPKEEWRRSHNYQHHYYTNVIGRDRDFGYGILRLSGDMRWYPRNIFQPVHTFMLATLFEWYVAVHDLALNEVKAGKRSWASVAKAWVRVKAKMWRQFRRDFIAWPLAAGVLALAFSGSVDTAVQWTLAVLAGNAVGGLIRNVWAFAIIFCGHFTEHIYTFAKNSTEGETKGQWYLRQILGSSNIRGGRLLHLMSGNLSHQIEHHLFPDIPANRYGEMAPQVREICAKYNVPYNTGSFFKQFGSVLVRLARYTLPGGSKQAVHLGQDPLRGRA